MKFNTDSPMLKYRQNVLNLFCFISLVSAFESINQIKAINYISKRTYESLTSKVGFSNLIDFENILLKNQKIDISEQVLYYNLKKYKQKGYLDIFNDMCVNVTLVQLIDSLGNVNNSISVLGYWIFDSNYEKPVINRKSLNILFALYVGE